MKPSAFVFLMLLTSCFAFGQANEDKNEYDENYEFPESTNLKANLGLGLGLDYGGIGGKLSILPAPNFAISAGFGWNINGLGWNAGLSYLFLPEKKVNPFATFMYGYNAVIVVEGLDRENKTYYGPTIGGGIQLTTKRENFWSFGLMIPFRSAEYRDHIKRLDNNPDIELTPPLPFAISVGYHLQL